MNVCSRRMDPWVPSSRELQIDDSNYRTKSNCIGIFHIRRKQAYYPRTTRWFTGSLPKVKCNLLSTLLARISIKCVNQAKWHSIMSLDDPYGCLLEYVIHRDTGVRPASEERHDVFHCDTLPTLLSDLSSCGKTNNKLEKIGVDDQVVWTSFLKRLQNVRVISIEDALNRLDLNFSSAVSVVSIIMSEILLGTTIIVITLRGVRQQRL